jgi:uncharacterized protein (TIGR03435 family)
LAIVKGSHRLRTVTLGAPDVPQSEVTIRQPKRTLLADRFKLVMHTEERVLPIYELSKVPSAKGGSSVRPSSEANCIIPSPDTLSAPFDRSRPTCGVLFSPTGYWTGRRVTIDSVANVLTRVLGRPVVNRTQLAGTFDLDLQWTDVSMLLSPNPSDPPPIADGPSLLMALRDQLGLERDMTYRQPVVGEHLAVGVSTGCRPADPTVCRLQNVSTTAVDSRARE